MINLIPPSARTSVKKEYWLRVVAAWMFLGGTGALIIVSLLLPTHVLLRSELAALRANVADNAIGVAVVDDNTAALTTAVASARLLASTHDIVSFSTYEAIITELANNSVTISNLEFTRAATTTKITVAGVANTRVALASFRDALETEPLLSEAILPISSLIRDRDLDFILTVTGLATTTP